MHVSEKKEGQRTASAKALRWEQAWCIHRTAWREGKENKSSRRVES